MKTVSLSGSSRENVGKKGAAELRKQERIPAVLYGGQQQVHFSISENEAKKLVFTPNVYLIDLEVNGKKVKAIVQETQIHPVTDRILHIDFFEVNETNPFKVKLPVKLEGFARGVRNGGRLRQNFRRLQVMGLVNDMPEDVTIDITSLRIGHKKRVSDLSISGLKFLDPANAVVVGVQTARAAVEDEEEDEEGAEGAEGTEGTEATAEGAAASPAEEGSKE
ncbi:MAG: 50S ribosomal protein L25/general stress protein Ctc [Crocinitomicaceae bacterium]|nr:50S ribosomal protein L25/general stress protein Ctc [Crocinitomicaceae bacterium]|tara:strand:+ start:869 stop:1531 length:663 start_codon:yes stop_codon:yes gene_type:complete